jgi:hypothetical protein
MSSSRMHPPMDVHVPTSWSGSVHSDAAFYCTSSQDNNSVGIESMDSINSVAASEEVVVNNTDSLLSLEESKKQTKFLEELLNYSESASLDSQGNTSSSSRTPHHPEYSFHFHQHTIIDNTISGQTDWAHADSASIAQERVNHPDNNNSLVNVMLGLFMAWGCQGNDLRRNDVTQQQQRQQPQSREPDIFEKIALIGHEGDLLDKVFSGFESTVCTEGSTAIEDRPENRILGAARHVAAAAATAPASATAATSPRITKAMAYSAPTTHASSSSAAATAAVPKKSSGSDILDSVFESMENVVCRDDLGEYTRGTISTNQAMVVHYEDMLDTVFHGVETLVCQDGPRDHPPVNHHHHHRRLGSERPPPRDDYVTNYIRTHRGDWRAAQPGEYSFDRDNSIVSEAAVNSRASEPQPFWNGRLRPPPNHQNQPQPMVKHGDAYLQSNHSGVAAAKSSQNHGDMLDFVFDGVETMVCNDDDDDDDADKNPYIGNRASQFDEDLPLKRFHWDDE